MKVWYEKPAQKWVESLPLGNGRIGAMVFGGIASERIALNEDTLWSGYPTNKNREGAAKYLSQAIQLSREKKFGELENLIGYNMLGDYSESYLPLGDLNLSFPNINESGVTEYYRDLHFNHAVAHTHFTYHGILYHREAFISHPDQVLVIRIWSDSKNAITMNASLSSQLKVNIAAKGSQIVMDGLCPSHVEPVYLISDNPIVYEEDDAKKGIQFSCITQVDVTSGTVQLHENSIVVSQADEVVIKFAVRSSFNGFNKRPYLDGAEYHQKVVDDLSSIASKSYGQLKEAHIKDFSALYERVDFSLGETGKDSIPTDERLRRFTPDRPDQHLYELIFQFGRYLMISSSRPGTQPTNLQGIWNRELRAPWSSNYTLNINTEMNYWLAESCNLSELHEPLFQMVEDLRTTGAETAKCHYAAHGVVSHHNTDIWRMANPVGRTDPITVCFAYWCMSYGWLCQHLFEHYEYTLDAEFLAQKAYPAIRDAALFYLDVMTEDKDGYLVLAPSTSPENPFFYDGVERKVAETATMTTAIIKEVFTNVIKCCKLLQIDEDFAALVEEKLALLKPYEISSSGRIMEWNEDFDEPNITNRHISHMYPLQPGHEITIENTPELAQACRRSLDVRGDEGSGWSLGWKVNCWARLRDGDRACKLLNRQLNLVDTEEITYEDGGGTYCSLLDAHPPFQIDGNFGTTAGIAQMFLQSNEDILILLPALPHAWKRGHMKGLCAMGAIECDIFVENNELEHAVIRTKKSRIGPVTVSYNAMRCEIQPTKGAVYSVSIDRETNQLVAKQIGISE